MKELTGKVAVVTGAASGIGRALAERFAREKMKVVLADVEEAPLAGARDAIAAAGGEAIAVRTDVSKPEDVERLRDRALAAFGAAHVVCNNAGVGAGGVAWERSIADWQWVIGVNLWGVIHGIRAFVPRMIEQGEGHVVNTASIAGLLSIAGMAPYCATKHAVVTISECLHHDLSVFAQGKVKVSVLCPGWVKTNIADSERNRPKDLAASRAAPTQADAMMFEMVRSAIASGIEPAKVADHVLSAIREERFYVFTHPEMKKAFRRRADEILEERLPTFDPHIA